MSETLGERERVAYCCIDKTERVKVPESERIRERVFASSGNTV